jgi:hypothetical protein
MGGSLRPTRDNGELRKVIMSTRRLNVSLPGLPKLGLYISLLLLPGGFTGLLLVCWLEHRNRGGDKPKGKTRMWYSQMRGWRDVIPGLWRFATSTPRLNLEIGTGAPVRERVDPAAQYI